MGKTTKSKSQITIEQLGPTQIELKLSRSEKIDLDMEDIIWSLDNVNQDLDEIRLNLEEFSSKEINKNQEEIYQGLIEIKETLEKF